LNEEKDIFFSEQSGFKFIDAFHKEVMPPLIDNKNLAMVHFSLFHLERRERYIF
jgi:hypothetical protein